MDIRNAKANICYEKVIFPELYNKMIFRILEIESCVMGLMPDLLDKCEIADADMCIDF